MSEAPKWEVITGDCTDADIRRQLPAFDAIVTDPPYGIDAGKMSLGKWRTSRMHKSGWDSVPADPSWILTLGLPCIIWGGNYFNLPPCRGYLVWHKGNGFRGRDFAECEMAWSNRHGNALVFTHDPLAFGDYRHKQHPTQKPVPVMVWSIESLGLVAGATIFDPYCGSGSTGAAALRLGHNFVGVEKDSGYAEDARERLHECSQQVNLF